MGNIGSPHLASGFAFNPAQVMNCGIAITPDLVLEAVVSTNKHLASFPSILWDRIDLKSSGSIIGALLGYDLARVSNSIVNPIEKGYPDILPASALGASEKELMNYPVGLEVKTTCGSVENSASVKSGLPRVHTLNGIAWKAHHREVNRLLAVIWDFVPDSTGNLPAVTSAYFSDSLQIEDWGEISGGGAGSRSTNVSNIRQSGKQKLLDGQIACLTGPFCEKYRALLAGGKTCDAVHRPSDICDSPSHQATLF